ncbi:hypothetical protein XA68_14493 [Ophiocordyceps unilateralis]|uniref:Uncharacterized protein n=1 Tax=Ophiocordyceps unilateralis TaxID=268505 RepID=A0A2A9PAF5_OPHUN|nr:hypothetical protein XA68_14493 [Ophiocordyceps unilateralis]
MTDLRLLACYAISMSMSAIFTAASLREWRRKQFSKRVERMENCRAKECSLRRGIRSYYRVSKYYHHYIITRTLGPIEQSTRNLLALLTHWIPLQATIDGLTHSTSSSSPVTVVCGRKGLTGRILYQLIFTLFPVVNRTGEAKGSPSCYSVECHTGRFVDVSGLKSPS